MFILGLVLGIVVGILVVPVGFVLFIGHIYR